MGGARSFPNQERDPSRRWAGSYDRRIDTEPFRFFDNREKYLLFVTTTSEKAEVARCVGREIEQLRPQPPALRVFDAGTGNGVVLGRVLRQIHQHLPAVPLCVVGKEISIEDIRLTLTQLPDRLAEHPDTVVALTNMTYVESPQASPRAAEATSVKREHSRGAVALATD